MKILSKTYMIQSILVLRSILTFGLRSDRLKCELLIKMFCAFFREDFLHTGTGKESLHCSFWMITLGESLKVNGINSTFFKSDHQ